MKHKVATAVFLSFLYADYLASDDQRRREDGRVTDAHLKVLAAKMQPPFPDPADTTAIKTAIEKGDLQKALSICQSLVKRPISEFETPWYGYRIKATAHAYLGQLVADIGGDEKDAIENELAAANLGHLGMLSRFSSGYLTRAPIEWYSIVSGKPAEELLSILRTGAALGERFSTAALGYGNLPLPVTADERLYWSMLAVFRDHVISREGKVERVGSILSKYGEKKIEEILNEFSIAGKPLPASPSGLPARGILETLFVDSDLRGSFGSTIGHESSQFERAAHTAPTIRDQFDFYSRFVPDNGFGDAYLLLVTRTKFEDKRIKVLERVSIMEGLVPGDRIFVKCGPLAHVAVLFERDALGKKLRFIDSAFHYWQPSHNSCVKDFSLVEGGYYRYLSVLRESDIMAMLQAVITIRDRNE